MKNSEELIHILGAGPAGLAAAYSASQAALPYVLYEASDQPGGNARTLRLEDCLYDTGAHRFHDKAPKATRLVKELLGDDLLPVNAPSVIYHQGRFLDFPLHLGSIVRSLPVSESFHIGLSFVASRLHSSNGTGSFSDVSISRYGKKLSEMFLFNYSEKLWGLPPEQLSSHVSGGRLKGLNFWSLLRDSFDRKRIHSSHLDGQFYYPKYGIGMIAERLANTLGKERVRYNSRITGLRHNRKRITGIEINQTELIATDRVVSTLPITVLVRLLNPASPERIIEASRSLRFRHMILLVVVIARDHLTDNASIYFPDRSIPFTRLYESKNRSSFMAPPGQTCIILELSCFLEDVMWREGESRLLELAKGMLKDLFNVREDEILAIDVERIPFAYPLLGIGIEEKLCLIIDYLRTFENLQLTGRSSTFIYNHIHDLILSGTEVIKQFTP